MGFAIVKVHLVHGVIPKRRPGSQLDKLYVEEGAFRAYLQARSRPYSPLEERGAGEDALTVDDATVAGFRACQIAISLGHSVTLFVNPYNIVHACPYSFSEMDHAFDVRAVETLRCSDTEYDLSLEATLRAARNVVKWRLAILPVVGHAPIIADLRRELRCGEAALPLYVRPLGIGDLRDLATSGVRIENHGWAHESIAAMPRDVFQSHYGDARSWLVEVLGTGGEHYAVPFGLPKPRYAMDIQGNYFIADPNSPEVVEPMRGYNRQDITDVIQRSADQTYPKSWQV